jgi:RsiW-degrading membrane proteinase PrsW (M82 family)
MKNREIALILRDKRTSLNKSIEEVSSNLGISLQRLAIFEIGDLKIPDDLLRKLLNYYGISVDDIGLDEVYNKKLSNNFFTVFKTNASEKQSEYKPELENIVKGFFQGFKKKPKLEVSYHIENQLFHPDKIDPIHPFIYLRFFLITILLAGLTIFTSDVVLSNLFLSASIPVTLLILVFELHFPRSIRGVDLFKYFMIGGILSIGLVYIIREFTGQFNILILENYLTGFVEETAKIILVVFFLRKHKVKSVITGLLIGFAVGTGFSVFETSSYGIYHLLFEEGTLQSMQELLEQRSMYSLLAVDHNFWTGILGGVIVFVSKTPHVKFKDLFHPLFLQAYLVVVSMHAFWNFSAYLESLLLSILVIIFCAAFFSIFFFVHCFDSYVEAKILLHNENDALKDQQ